MRGQGAKCRTEIDFLLQTKIYLCQPQIVVQHPTSLMQNRFLKELFKHTNTILTDNGQSAVSEIKQTWKQGYILKDKHANVTLWADINCATILKSQCECLYALIVLLQAAHLLLISVSGSIINAPFYD